MKIVYILLVTHSLGAAPVQKGTFNTYSACEKQRLAYKNARCLESENKTVKLYSTCWGCMHGCTEEMIVRPSCPAGAQ